MSNKKLFSSFNLNLKRGNKAKSTERSVSLKSDYYYVPFVDLF